MKTIVVTTRFTVLDDAEQPVTDSDELLQLAHDTVQVIRNRLFGAGFLPDDRLVGTYDVVPQVKEIEA